MIFVVPVTDYDGLALGSEFVDISTIHCKLCQGFWSWSKPPYSQRDMEGSQVLCLLFEKTLFMLSGKLFDVSLVSRFWPTNISTMELSLPGSLKYIGNRSNNCSGTKINKLCLCMGCQQ